MARAARTRNAWRRLDNELHVGIKDISPSVSLIQVGTIDTFDLCQGCKSGFFIKGIIGKILPKFAISLVSKNRF